MATRQITKQEQELADASGGRYRTDLSPDGVALNHRPPRGGSTYIPEERNTAGAGRGGQGGPTAKEIEGKKKGGKVSSASSRADGIAQRGKTRGTIVMCGGGYMKGKK